MKITALYKVFDGGEWLEASIKGIYNQVDNIVILNSEQSWYGLGKNNCGPTAYKMSMNDPKIELINFNSSNQMEQYYYGFDVINRMYKPELIMLVDADEIWEDTQIHIAKDVIVREPFFEAYRCNVKTYIKSPYYRIAPPEPIEPVAFVRGGLKDYGKLIRCCDMEKKMCMQGVFYHHFSYVRKDFNSILYKFFNSHHSEQQATEPLDYWISKWNNLPKGNFLHPAIGFQDCWHHVDVIKRWDLPKVLRDNDFDILTDAATVESVNMPDGLLEDKDKELLYDYAKVDLAVELGTFRCQGAVILASRARQVFTVDAYGEFGNTEEKPYCIEDNRKTIEPHDNIELIKSISWEASKLFEDNSIDLIFIDACHGYEEVKKDCMAYLPKVKLGGLILFHDHNDLHPDVKIAVQELEGHTNALTYEPMSNKYYQCENPSSIKVLRKVENV
jgi:hypothetical protein